MTKKKLKSILITGASSGIGAALAKEYASPGVKLVLIGRQPRRLKITQDTCLRLGATVFVAISDVTDKNAMEKIFDDFGPFHIVIANAGISSSKEQNMEQNTREIFSVNIDGVANTVLPAILRMQEQGGGNIGIVSSIAGFRGLPSAPAYSASKAASKVWGEGLRSRYASKNIVISVICPGFVETPMTDKNDFFMPWKISSSLAAKSIRQGMDRGQSLIIFPWQMALVINLIKFVPRPVVDWIFQKLPRKE